MDHLEKSGGSENSAKVDVDFKVPDNSWLSLIRAGARWSERDETTRSTIYNWGVLSEQWGNGGPVWLSDPVDGVPNGAGGTLGTPVGGGTVPTSSETAFGFNGFFRGLIPNPLASPYLFSNINGSTNYKAYSAFASSIVNEWTPGPATGGSTGWVPLADRPGACNAQGMSNGVFVKGCEPGFLPGEVSPSTESTYAGYVMAKFGHATWGDQSFDGNIGVRYVVTDHNTSGSLQFPSDTLPNETNGPNGCFAPAGSPPGSFVAPPFCSLPASVKNAARAFASGAFVTENASNSYAYLLPALNLKYNLNDQMLIRFGLSQTISRPAMGQTMLSYNISILSDTPGVGGAPAQWGGFGTSNQNGNPFLKPVRADNVDLSYEWYFGPSNSVTISAFYKQLHNVITQSVQDVSITNTASSTPFDVLVTTPINSTDVGKVKGFEFAYQQFYDFLPAPFDGLGMNANFTYIDSTGVAQDIFNLNPQAASQVPNGAVNLSKLPLEQLSRYNFNLQGIYEKYGWSARVAYTWRSRFLLTAYDVIVPHSPIMNDSTGQMDASVFYAISDNVKVGLEGTNLLDTITKTEQVLTTGPLLLAPRAWYITDRRVTAALRFSF